MAMTTPESPPPRHRRVGGLEFEYALGDTPEIAKDNLPGGVETDIIRPITNAALPEGVIRANDMLNNGGRFYKDGEHAEYATPETKETDDLRWLDEVVAVQIVGEEIPVQTFHNAVRLEQISAFSLHKRVIDSRGTTWGVHESLSTRRDTLPLFHAPERVPGVKECVNEKLDLWVTALALRNLFFGAGAMYGGQFIIGQKASQLESEISSTTTFNKPLVHTRDEPLADGSLYHRMHITCIDPHLSPFAMRASIAYDALFLSMVEAGERADDDTKLKPGTGHKLAQQVSTDATFQKRWELANGEVVQPIHIMGSLIARAKEFLVEKRAGGTESERWIVNTLSELYQGFLDDPLQLTDLDWVMRHRIINKRLKKEGLDWNEGSNWLKIAEQSDLLYDHLGSSRKLGKKSVAQAFRESAWQQWMPDAALITARMTKGPPGRARLRGDAIQAGAEYANWLKVKHQGSHFFTMLPDPHKAA